MRTNPTAFSLYRLLFAFGALIVLGLSVTAVIIALAHRMPEGFVKRGYAKYDKGDLDGAIADYSRAIKIDAKNAEAYRERGRARFYRKDNDGAIEDFTRLIELDPKQAFGWHARGLAKSAKHDFDGSIADYTNALELDAKDRACYLNTTAHVALPEYVITNAAIRSYETFR